jgi:hypothetical protein
MELKRQEYANEIELAKSDDAFLAELIENVNPKRQKKELREMSSQVLMVLAEDAPDRIQPFINDFYIFLDGKNSFSKMVSIYCIAGLVLADMEPAFPSNIFKYLAMLNDDSVMIASHCALNCGKIAAAKRVFESAITQAFLSIQESNHQESRMDLAIAYVINAFAEFANHSARLDEINAFVWGQMENASPKAREAAKSYMEKFQS